MSTLQLLAGPLIGAAIGYSTNYLAVKMLFRPLRPIRIGRFRLPFTPGIIPKRKDELAKALGNAVGNNLLTGQDIENMFLTDQVKDNVIASITDLLSADQGRTLKEMLTAYWQEEDYLLGKEQVVQILSEKIMAGITGFELGEVIARESRKAIKEKVEGTMFALMANDKLINSLTAPLGAKVEKYIRENGLEIIRPIVSYEISRLENRTVGGIWGEFGLDKDHLTDVLSKIYSEFIRQKVAGFIQQFDIPGVVEEKVNAMDASEIEKLVLSVMKKELRAIINLGALLGLVIGMLNILIK